MIVETVRLFIDLEVFVCLQKKLLVDGRKSGEKIKHMHMKQKLRLMNTQAEKKMEH